MIRIEHKTIEIREIIDGYKIDEHGGIRGFGGNLDIRPQYQREYIHENNLEFQKKLIDSIYNELPIGVFYWAEKQDGTYELLDGQQRIITICKYVVDRSFSIKISDAENYFFNLDDTNQKKILDYRLMIFICKGNYDDKMNWFKTINTGSERLSDQELRNAIYSGSWVNSAKRYFTARGNHAEDCNKLMPGRDRIRQKHLEIAISWHINDKDDAINAFMAKNQNKESAKELWDWYRKLLNWVEKIFGANIAIDKKVRTTIDWGELWHQYHEKHYDSKHTQTRLHSLFKMHEKEEDGVDNTEYPFIQIPKGIYQYILEGETIESRKYINKTSFSKSEKQKKWKEQNKKFEGENRICKQENCNSPFNQSHGDHITPRSKGGRTIFSNLQMLCESCNRKKSDS